MAAQHIVAVVGSYRREGTLDRTVEAVLAAAEAEGATTETIRLAEHRILFCTNCRECTQAPGESRGACPLVDDVDRILDRMEQADALVLAAPVNCLDVTAVTRALLERMIAYYHWPFGAPAPKPRHTRATRRAVLVTSAAMPTLMGLAFTRALATLKTMARTIGAKPSGSLFVGLSGAPRETLPVAVQRRARRLGQRLVGDG